MNILANYSNGTRYFYAPAATLACLHLAPRAMGIKIVPLYVTRPKKGGRYHRVEINVVRTKAEADKMNAKYARIRAKIALKHGIKQENDK